MIWGLLSGLMLLPLLGGLGLLIIPRRARYPQIAWYVTLGLSGLAAACGLALLPYGEREIYTVTWLPGTGTLTFHVGGAGLYAAIATGSMLVLNLITTRLIASHKSKNGGEEHRLFKSAFSPSLWLVAVAAANASFLAGHFLGRYVALEVVGLCIALAPLLEQYDAPGARQARFVYLLLRIGDAGLLTAILILLDAGNTLTISDALQVGTTLTPAYLAWVVGGFILAVWVKVSAWPLHSWQRASAQLSPVTQTWLYAILMPNLGIYLLYRVTPLLILSTPLRWIILGLSTLSTLLAVMMTLMRANVQHIPVYGNAIWGSLALSLAALGLKSTLIPLLLITTPLRLLVLYWPKQLPHPSTSLLGQRLERGLFKTAQVAHQRMELGILEQGLAWTAQAVMGSAMFVYRVVEQEGLEGVLRAVARSTLALSQWMQRRHTGRLRTNLIWITVSLVLAVTLLTIRGW